VRVCTTTRVLQEGMIDIAAMLELLAILWMDAGKHIVLRLVPRLTLIDP
jgi:hypothetical protein